MVVYPIAFRVRVVQVAVLRRPVRHRRPITLELRGVSARSGTEEGGTYLVLHTRCHTRWCSRIPSLRIHTSSPCASCNSPIRQRLSLIHRIPPRHPDKGLAAPAYRPFLKNPSSLLIIDAEDCGLSGKPSVHRSLIVRRQKKHMPRCTRCIRRRRNRLHPCDRFLPSASLGCQTLVSVLTPEAALRKTFRSMGSKLLDEKETINHYAPIFLWLKRLGHIPRRSPVAFPHANCHHGIWPNVQTIPLREFIPPGGSDSGHVCEPTERCH